MKAGLLLPRSGEYPAIAVDLTVAIRRCLKEQGLEEEMQFVSENIGFGGAEKEVYEKAERLLVTEGVDLLIAYADMKVMSILEPLAYVTGKLIIILNSGANFPENKVPQPGIIYLTLQQSFCCGLTGTSGGNNAGIYATSFYDCGYMHGAAMMDHFCANNGRVIFNYVNKDKYDDSFQIPELKEFLAAQTEEKINLLCVMDTAAGNLLYRRLAELPQAGRLSLFVSPMMLAQQAIGEGGYPFSIEGYTSWPNRNDHIFNEIYGTEYKKEPGIFSLSGWEAGLLLAELLKQKDLLQEPLETIMEKIGQLILKSPRADLRLDPDTNFFIGDRVYLCNLPAGEKTISISPVHTDAKQWKDFVQSQNNQPASGWVNTYLCY